MRTKTSMLLSILCLLAGRVEADNSGIVVSIGVSKQQFRVGEPIVLAITVTNAGKESVDLPEPSVQQKTLVVELSSNGRSVSAQMQWCGAFDPPTVELAANGSLKREYDLARLFPCGLAPGKYQVKIRCQIDDSRVVISEPLTIAIDVPSEKEASMVKEYLVVLKDGGGNVDVARLGMEFLRKWPEAAFENHVRMEVAAAFASMGSHAESLFLYNRVAESISAPDWEKQEANFRAANILAKGMPKAEGAKMAATVNDGGTITATDLATAGDGGMPEATGEYLVIDLSGGPSASNYPVGYLSAMPAGGWNDEYKTTKLVLRNIPAGTFAMGSPTNELVRFDNENQHTVTLTQAFYIGVFEVTQHQWELVMSNRPSYFSNRTDYASRPVEQVSSYDIREDPANSKIVPGWPITYAVHADSFMGKLRAKTRLTGFDLPTESQWEYACRAGTSTALNSGHDLTSEGSNQQMNVVGRYKYNCGEDLGRIQVTSVVTAKVGSYLPNAWGLYDMHGNVWEWCLDRYAEYPMHSNVWAWCFDWHRAYPATVTNPKGDSLQLQCVFRGGSWRDDASECRSAIRGYNSPQVRQNICGFRVCCIPRVNRDLKQSKETIGGAGP